MRRTFLILTTVLLLVFAVGAVAWPRLREQSALTTSYSPAVLHHQTVPLDAYELVSGVLFFRETATRLVASKESHQDRLTALMEWTHENVRPQFAAPTRVVPDTFVDIVRRGHGYCDQSAHVFATLAHFAGYRAHLLFLRRPDGRSPHTVAEVLVDGHWVLVDPWIDHLFVDREGRLAGVEDLGVSADLPEGYAAIGIDAGFFQRGTPFESFPYQPWPDFVTRVWNRIVGAPALRPPEGERAVRTSSSSASQREARREQASSPSTPRPQRPPREAAAPGQGRRVDSQVLVQLDGARRDHLDARFDEAATAYQALLNERVPEDIAEAVRFFLGLALLRSGAGSDAVAAFDEAIVAAPNSEWAPSVLYYRSEARWLAGDIDGAIADLRAANIPPATAKLGALTRRNRG